MNAIFGTPIVEHAWASKVVSGKPHPWKKWMHRKIYHARIEKKWAHRYGKLIIEPCIFKMRDPYTGRDLLLVHPSLMPQLREIARNP